MDCKSIDSFDPKFEVRFTNDGRDKPDFLNNKDHLHGARLLSSTMRNNLFRVNIRQLSNVQNILVDLLQYGTSINGNIPYIFDSHIGYLSFMIDSCANAKITGEYNPQENTHSPYGIIIVKDQEQMEKIYDIALKLAHDLNVNLVRSLSSRDESYFNNVMENCDIIFIPADTFNFCVKQELVFFNQLAFLVVHGLTNDSDLSRLQQYQDMFTYKDLIEATGKRLIFFDDNYKHEIVENIFKDFLDRATIEYNHLNVELPRPLVKTIDDGDVAVIRDLLQEMVNDAAESCDGTVTVDAEATDKLKSLLSIKGNMKKDSNDAVVVTKQSIDREQPKDEKCGKNSWKIENDKHSLPFEVYCMPGDSEEKLLQNGHLDLCIQLKTNVRIKGYEKINECQQAFLQFVLKGFDVIGNPPFESDLHVGYICFLLDACLKAKNSQEYASTENNPFAVIVVGSDEAMLDKFYRLAVALAEDTGVSVNILTEADLCNNDVVNDKLKHCDVLLRSISSCDAVSYALTKYVFYHNAYSYESQRAFTSFKSVFDSVDRKNIQIGFFDVNYSKFEMDGIFHTGDIGLMKFSGVEDTVQNALADGSKSGDDIVSDDLHDDNVLHSVEIDENLSDENLNESASDSEIPDAEDDSDNDSDGFLSVENSNNISSSNNEKLEESHYNQIFNCCDTSEEKFADFKQKIDKYDSNVPRMVIYCNSSKSLKRVRIFLEQKELRVYVFDGHRHTPRNKEDYENFINANDGILIASSPDRSKYPRFTPKFANVDTVIFYDGANSPEEYFQRACMKAPGVFKPKFVESFIIPLDYPPYEKLYEKYSNEYDYSGLPPIIDYLKQLYQNGETGDDEVFGWSSDDDY